MTENGKKTLWQRLVRIGAILGAIAAGLLACGFILALFGPTISGRRLAADDGTCLEAVQTRQATTLQEPVEETMVQFDIPAGHPVLTADNAPQMVEVTHFAVTDARMSYLLRFEGSVLRVVEGGDWPPRYTTLSPDGARLVVVDVAPSEATVIRVCDTDGGAQIKAWPSDETTRDAAFTPDGTRLIVNEGRGIVAVYDADSLRRVARWNVRQGDQWRITYQLAIHPEGTLAAFGTGSDSGYVLYVWSIADNQQVAVLTGHTSTPVDLAFSPDGTRLASLSTDGTLRIWAVQDE